MSNSKICHTNFEQTAQTTNHELRNTKSCKTLAKTKSRTSGNMAQLGNTACTIISSKTYFWYSKLPFSVVNIRRRWAFLEKPPKRVSMGKIVDHGADSEKPTNVFTTKNKRTSMTDMCDIARVPSVAYGGRWVRGMFRMFLILMWRQKQIIIMSQKTLKKYISGV